MATCFVYIFINYIISCICSVFFGPESAFIGDAELKWAADTTIQCILIECAVTVASLSVESCYSGDIYVFLKFVLYARQGYKSCIL